MKKSLLIFFPKMIGINLKLCDFCFQFHADVVKKIRELSKETGKECGILLDTKGPEIRTGGFKDGRTSVKLKAGQTFTFYVNFIRGDETKVSIKYWNLPKLVKVSSLPSLSLLIYSSIHSLTSMYIFSSSFFSFVVCIISTIEC
jgi:hypothetical protein